LIWTFAILTVYADLDLSAGRGIAVRALLMATSEPVPIEYQRTFIEKSDFMVADGVKIYRIVTQVSQPCVPLIKQSG
jgi:hypothetical protein